jgi:LacI family transcriptional regulator
MRVMKNIAIAPLRSGRRPMESESVTIRDVAHATGFSVATISRVLNGKAIVRDETRRRVLAAAAKLRWVPHSVARSLTTRVTHTIGVVLPDIFGEFFSELIRGIDVTARGRGYHLLVSSSHSDETETKEVLRAMRGRVDGAVVMSPMLPAGDLRANLPEGMPAVFLNCLGGKGFDSVNVDNFGGARAVVRHLCALGHRRIAFVGGPAGNRDASERLRGYRAALRERASMRSDGMEYSGDFTEESGFRTGRRILLRPDRPSAVFAANDAMAIGCLFALHEARVAVPDEMALAGFDDTPMARYVTPPLTTVRLSVGELGARALERLLVAIAAGPKHHHRHDTLGTELVVRASSDMPFRSTTRLEA